MKAWNWKEIEPDEREYWSIPSKDVFQFMFHLRSHNQNKVYDLGCGIGRNLFFLIDMGFDVYGSDYSLDAVIEVNNRLEKSNYPQRVKHESMTEITEPTQSYDAVIAYNVIYHACLADMIKTLENIYRILKPSGSLLITFQAKTSPTYKKELEIEDGTTIKKEGHETGILHHFVDRNEIIKLLNGYHIIEISYVEHEYDNLKFKGCHYIVTAMKL
jgi:2-polyprenyl-3-methyl-5-hydroxy-6-metoxy-1,4-benzoquinol methylase